MRNVHNLKRKIAPVIIAALLTPNAFPADKETALLLQKTGATLLAAEGTYTNKASRFVFPDRIQLFDREKILAYKKDESDISVGYNSPHGIAATVYVYPIKKIIFDKSLAEELEFVRTDVGKTQEELHLWKDIKFDATEGVTNSIGGQTVQGLHLGFGLTKFHGGKPTPHRSEIYIFRNGNRFLQFRFTYPRYVTPFATNAISSFISKTSWPN